MRSTREVFIERFEFHLNLILLAENHLLFLAKQLNLCFLFFSTLLQQAQLLFKRNKICTKLVLFLEPCNLTFDLINILAVPGTNLLQRMFLFFNATHLLLHDSHIILECFTPRSNTFYFLLIRLYFGGSGCQGNLQVLDFAIERNLFFLALPFDLLVELDNVQFFLLYFLFQFIHGELLLCNLGMQLLTSLFKVRFFSFCMMNLDAQERCAILFNLIINGLAHQCLITILFEFFQMRFAFGKNDVCLLQPSFYLLQFAECLLFFFFIGADTRNVFDDFAPFNASHLNKLDNVSLENNI